MLIDFFAGIWILDKTRQKLVLSAQAGARNLLDEWQHRIKLKDPLNKLAMIVRGKEAIIVNYVHSDSRFEKIFRQNNRVVSFIRYPLTMDDRLLGLLLFFDTKPFDYITLSYLKPVADLIEIAVHNDRHLRDDEKRTKELIRANKAG